MSYAAAGAAGGLFGITDTSALSMRLVTPQRRIVGGFAVRAMASKTPRRGMRRAA
jgi:hypothetical protein